VSQSSVSFDRDAVLGGVLVGSVVTVPAGLVVATTDSTVVRVMLTLVLIAGLVLAGSYTAWRQRRDAPISHAFVVAVGVFVVTQIAGWLRRVMSDDEISLNAAIANALLCVVFGLIGGLIGSRMRRSQPPSS
jgi:xanthosine utilization system XapX-like protein